MQPWLVTPLLLAGCAAAADHAQRPTPSSAPSPSKPIPSAGVTAIATAAGKLDFTMDARRMAAECGRRGGELSGFVTSNLLSTVCKVPSDVFSKVIVGYCAGAKAEHACLIVESSDELPAEGAATAKAQKAQQLSRLYGSPTGNTDTATKWGGADETAVELSVQGNDATRSVQALYASAEGLRVIANYPPEFPSKVLEFTFGTPKSAAKEGCVGQSGVYFDTFDVQDVQSPVKLDKIACMRPRTELPFELKNAYAFFCDDHLCEVELELVGGIEKAVATVSRKYGVPVESNEPGACNPAAKRYSWTWSSGSQTIGTMRLVDDCSLTLKYDDATGWALREGERQRRFKNF